MSRAEQARTAIRTQPFIHEALRAGVLNYHAAARLLDVDGDPEAIATALRRYEETLDSPTASGTPPIVRLERNVGITDGPGDDPLLTVDGLTVTSEGDYAAVLVTGMETTRAFAKAVTRVTLSDIPLRATGGAFPSAGTATAVFVVPTERGTDALREIEATIGDRPTGSKASLR